ncbi:MAG: NADH-quinone oxidoreductase subunit L [Bacteroidota bacterium]
MDFSYTIWILLIPLISFVFTGLFGKMIKPIFSGIIGTTGLFIVCILSWITGYQYFFNTEKIADAYQTIIGFNTVWLNLTDALQIKIGVLLDPISVMMICMVTTVSLMVHIYSIGYMKGDSRFHAYFAFLSLFSAAMLGLIIATNIFQMYIFWELVGVSSYLLIGHYYDRPSAVAASKKAFIVTRFADLGFLIGILLFSFFTNTFDFVELTNPNNPAILQAASQTFMGFSVISIAMLLIFTGGAGKSAMFPLHIWLPDAMEGPTPVSALIHAATMVVAGVYLVARLFPIYSIIAPNALEIIAYIGGFTSLFAAVIACTQIDIKRVLAFSTLSQIGYMMLALGVSGYGEENGLGFMASMFHLFTHAWFKALLFLGAGAVIHAVHSNNWTDMGNLRKYLPITHITFLIACLTISGIPPLSGFFSKDEILVAAFNHNKLLFAIEYFVAGLTAFYMFRLYFLVFWGKETHYHHTPHEAPAIMTFPLIFLAIASIFAGLIPFSEFVTSDKMSFHTQMHWNIALPSIAIALAGILLAGIFYRKESALPDLVASKIKGFYMATFHKFYIDEIYLFVTKRIIFNLIAKSCAWFDRHIIDGAMNGIAFVTSYFSEKTKGLQSGQLQQYAFVFISGVLALVLVFVYMITK